MDALDRHRVHFGELKAAENTAARAEVLQFADELHDSQGKTWRDLRSRKAECKPHAPTPQECRDKSAEVRVMRERDATYFNDTTNPYA